MVTATAAAPQLGGAARKDPVAAGGAPSSQRNDWAPPAACHSQQACGNWGGGQGRALSPQGDGHWGGGQEQPSLPPRSYCVSLACQIPRQAGVGDGRHPRSGGRPPEGVNCGRSPDQGHRPPQHVSAPPARGSLALAGCRCAPPPDGVSPLRQQSTAEAAAHRRRRQPTGRRKPAESRHRRLQNNAKPAELSAYRPNAGRRQPSRPPRPSRRHVPRPWGRRRRTRRWRAATSRRSTTSRRARTSRRTRNSRRNSTSRRTKTIQGTRTSRRTRTSQRARIGRQAEKSCRQKRARRRWCTSSGR